MKLPQYTHSSCGDLYSCLFRCDFVTSSLCYLLIDACEGNVSEWFLRIFVLYGEGGGVGFEEFQHGFEQGSIRSYDWNISPVRRRHRLGYIIQGIGNGQILKLAQYAICSHQFADKFVGWIS